MTWIKFTTWLCGAYVAYYAALISWDFICRGPSHTAEDTHQLTFVEHYEPSRPEAESSVGFFPSAIISSGGQSLKQIFTLAKEEAIEYTRVVSF